MWRAARTRPRRPAESRTRTRPVGVSQEFQRVWSATRRDTQTAAPQYTFVKADRRVTCYYFYLWDDDFGPAFIVATADTGQLQPSLEAALDGLRP